MLSDLLGMEIGYAAGHEGSGLGAALLGHQVLGTIASIDVAVDLVTLEQVTRPQPAAAAVYTQLLPVFTALYDALVPTFAALKQLSPGPRHQPT